MLVKKKKKEKRTKTITGCSRFIEGQKVISAKIMHRERKRIFHISRKTLFFFQKKHKKHTFIK